jgi:hypothetical protein
MTGRRDYPPPPPAELNEKLPQPLPPSQREPQPVVAEPQPVAPVPQPLAFADRFSAAAERGAVAWISEHAASRLPEIIGMFTGTGVYQGEGSSASAAAIVVGRQMRRLVAEVTRPGRTHDRPTFDLEIGTEADLSNAAVLRWLGTLIDEARELRVPVLMLLTPDVLPPTVSDEVKAELWRMAAPGVCVALIAGGDDGEEVRLTTAVSPEPAEDRTEPFVPHAPSEATKRKLMDLPRSSFSPSSLKKIDEWRAQTERKATDT